MAQKLQAEDLAKERIIEHQLLFEKSQRKLPDLAREEVEEEFKRFTKGHGGEKGFLQKFKIRKSDLPKVKQEMADDLRFRKYIQSIYQQLPEVTEEQIQSEYEKSKASFKRPDEYKAAHIVYHTNNGQDSEEAKAKADDALARLQKGESFEKIADEESDGPGNGGDLGWFAEGYMVQEFEDVVFKLEFGKCSDVFQTPFGYHIARLDDKREGNYVPLEEVSKTIRQKLETENRDQKFKEILSELRSQADIRTA
ncbi:MAG: peptidylprolyl isomerase [Verrucomicrobiota bacterium]|nr:peptidylprolyl isomerase [Verrucomicrobiota bacterium]